LPNDPLFPKNDLKEYYGKEVAFTGQIVEEPDPQATKTRYILQLLASEANPLVQPVGRVLVATRIYPEYKFGEYLKVSGKLEEPPEFDEFSYKDYLVAKGVFGIMNYPEINNQIPNSNNQINLNNQTPNFINEMDSRSDVKPRIFDLRGNDTFVSRLSSIVGNVVFEIRKWAVEIKEKFTEALDRVVPDPYASFVLGILVGGRKGIPKDLNNAFASTGVAHVVAVSGYNISIITSAVGKLLRKALPNWLSLTLLLLFVGLFMLAAGLSASVIRAGIMGIVLLWAMLSGRQSVGVRLLVYATALMLLVNPLLLRYDAGFQLSVLATAGLILIGPKIEPFFLKLKLPNFWHEALLATVSATIVSLPILVLNFKQVSVVSPLVNLIILPLIPWTMMAGFATGIFAFLWQPLGMLFGFAAFGLCYAIIEVVGAFASLPFAHISVSLGWMWSIPYYFVILLLVYGKRSKRITEEGNPKSKAQMSNEIQNPKS